MLRLRIFFALIAKFFGSDTDGGADVNLRGVLEVSDNLLPPEMQTKFIDSWFNEIGHKVGFATWDNHGIMRQEMLPSDDASGFPDHRFPSRHALHDTILEHSGVVED